MLNYFMAVTLNLYSNSNFSSSLFVILEKYLTYYAYILLSIFTKYCVYLRSPLYYSKGLYQHVAAKHFFPLNNSLTLNFPFWLRRQYTMCVPTRCDLHMCRRVGHLSALAVANMTS